MRALILLALVLCAAVLVRADALDDLDRSEGFAGLPDGTEELPPAPPAPESETDQGQKQKEVLLPPPQLNDDARPLDAMARLLALLRLAPAFPAQATCVVLLLVFACNYAAGAATNSKRAALVERAIGPLVEQQFSSVRAAPGEPLFVKQAAHAWLLTATGRINAHGAQMQLEFPRRQDLFMQVLGSVMLLPEKERLSVHVAFNPADCKDAFVFALVRKQERRSFLRANKAVADWCGQATVPDLPLLCFSEHDELTGHLLNPSVVGVLKRYESLVESLLITDQWGSGVDDPAAASASASTQTPAPYPRRMQVRLLLPRNTGDFGDLEVLLRMLFFLFDASATLTLSRHASERGAKHRRASAAAMERAAHAARQEALAKKTLDKAARIKAELEALPPDERAKREEALKRKEQRKAMKRLGGKVKVVK